MATPRLQAFFRSTEGYGWSEKYFYNGPTDNVSGIPILDIFVTDRCAFLSQDVTLIRVRVETAHKRDPAIFDYDGKSFAQGQYPMDMNNPGNAIIIRMEAAGIGYNKVFMRGLPDTLVSANQFLPDAAWLTSFNAFKAFMLNSGWWEVQAQLDNPQPVQQVLVVTRTPPTKGYSMTFQAGATMPALGDILAVSGSTILGYNGRKTVTVGPTVASPLTISVGGALPEADPAVGDVFKVRKLVFTSAGVDQFFIENFVQRKPGRPFGLARGRARTLFSLRQ